MALHFLPVVAVCLAFAISGCTKSVPPAAQLPPPADCGASLLQDIARRTGRWQFRSRCECRRGSCQLQRRHTGDYSESRLNLATDGSRNLVRASCG